MADESGGPNWRRVATALIVGAVTAAVLMSVSGAVDGHQQRINSCDEEHGEDGWVFVEVSEPPWWVQFHSSTGEVKCVSTTSDRAVNCVMIDGVIADYNARCGEIQGDRDA